QSDGSSRQMAEHFLTDPLLVIDPRSKLDVFVHCCKLAGDPLQKVKVRRRVGFVGARSRSLSPQHQIADAATTAAESGSALRAQMISGSAGHPARRKMPRRSARSARSAFTCSSHHRLWSLQPVETVLSAHRCSVGRSRCRARFFCAARTMHPRAFPFNLTDLPAGFMGGHAPQQVLHSAPRAGGHLPTDVHEAYRTCTFPASFGTRHVAASDG